MIPHLPVLNLLPPVQQQALAAIVTVVCSITGAYFIAWWIWCEVTFQRKMAAYHRQARHRKPAYRPQLRLALPAPVAARRLAIEAPPHDGGLATVRAIDPPRPELAEWERQFLASKEAEEPFIGEPVHLPLQTDRARRIGTWLRHARSAPRRFTHWLIGDDDPLDFSDMPRPGSVCEPTSTGQLAGPGQPDGRCSDPPEVSCSDAACPVHGEFWEDDDDDATETWHEGLHQPEPQFVPDGDWAPAPGRDGSEDTLTGTLVTEFWAGHPEWARL